jgi:small-conductance mechanosensitive channel
MTYNSSFNLFFAQSDHEESSNSHHSASVPIAVYRQLTEELNVTQTRLKFAEQENRKLAQQNQQLKQELANVIKQSEDLKKLVANFEFTINYPSPNIERAKQEQIIETSAPTRPKNRIKKPKTKINRSGMVKEIHAQYSPQLSKGEFKETNGIFLAIALIFIVLITLGSGFLVIKTVLSNNNR